jgi:hypothetical protein
MIRAVVIAMLLAAVQPSVQVEAAAQPMPRSRETMGTAGGTPGGRQAAGFVYLRGLDTLNGTAEDIDVGVGQTIRFGHLEITAEACRLSGEDGGDAYALLRIRDIRETELRFAGWMFASSPALSALDHPRYDVWVLSCSNR